MIGPSSPLKPDSPVAPVGPTSPTTQNMDSCMLMKLCLLQPWIVSEFSVTRQHGLHCTAVMVGYERHDDRITTWKSEDMASDYLRSLEKMQPLQQNCDIIHQWHLAGNVPTRTIREQCSLSCRMRLYDGFNCSMCVIPLCRWTRLVKYENAKTRCVIELCVKCQR